MPSKKPTEAASPLGLSNGELRFIKVMFDNMTQKPDADWEKVAMDLGLKDAKCAKERYRQMSVRHGWNSGQKASPSKGKSGNPLSASSDGKVIKKQSPQKFKKEDIEDEEPKKEESAFEDEI